MEQLVRKAIKGDGEAFATLIENNMQSLYKIAWIYLKNDADVADAVQDTILACFEKIHTLQNPKYFKTWMIRILINKSTDIVRKKVNVADAENILESYSFEPQYEHCEWKLLMNALEEKYSAVLNLYYYDELSVKEISKLLGVKQNTVLTRLRRGRRLLREELEGGCAFDNEKLVYRHCEK